MNSNARKDKIGDILGDGYSAKVEFEHYRFANNTSYLLIQRYHVGKKAFEPAPYGGLTICKLTVSCYSGTFETRGVAKCSVKDHFCYKVGRDIAYGRALKRMTSELLINEGAAEVAADYLADFNNVTARADDTNVVNIRIDAAVTTGSFTGVSIGRIG